LKDPNTWWSTTAAGPASTGSLELSHVERQAQRRKRCDTQNERRTSRRPFWHWRSWSDGQPVQRWPILPYFGAFDYIAFKVDGYNVVDSEADKNLAGVRANAVPGIFSVINNLQVVPA
jgi:hypothetical protein